MRLRRLASQIRRKLFSASVFKTPPEQLGFKRLDIGGGFDAYTKVTNHGIVVVTSSYADKPFEEGGKLNTGMPHVAMLFRDQDSFNEWAEERANTWADIHNFRDYPTLQKIMAKWGVQV